MATKMTKQERLARMRQALTETDTGSGNAGFVGSLKEGVTILRILPEVKDMPRFFQEVGTHVMPGKDGKRVYCPKFTSRGKLECPICELVQQLYQQGDTASKAFAGEIRVKKSYWMNVIERSKEKDGPKIYTPGVKAFGQTVSYIQDPDYGDITDVDEGYDIKVERKGTGRDDTDYQVRVSKVESPAGSDEEIDEWLEKARDLSFAEASINPDEDAELAKDHAVYVLPYKRIVKELDLDNLEVEVDAEEGDTEEVDEDEPHRKVSSHKRYEEEEDNDDVEEDEPVRKPVVTRTARHSTRR